MTCENCKYWEYFGTDTDTETRKGNCKRYPPVYDPVYTGSTDETGSPSDPNCFVSPCTESVDWCGEWHAR